MTGSVQSKGKKWYCVVNLKDDSGKRKTKWIATGISVSEKGSKKKAEQALKEQLAKYAGINPATGCANTLFHEYCKQWLSKKECILATSTYEGYAYRIQHILDYFSSRRIRLLDLSPRMVEDFYYYLLKSGNYGSHHKNDGLSYRSAKDIATLLNAILDDAVRLKDIAENPARDIPVPKKSRTEIPVDVFIGTEDLPVFRAAIKGHPLENLLTITLYYGLRRSEALGLKWDAIDFEKRTVAIHHTVTKVKTVTAQDTTKTEASYREYPMTGFTGNILRKIKQDQRINRMAFGKDYQSSSYVFTWPDGHPFSPDYVSHAFKKIIRSCPKLNSELKFHDLRKSSVSMMIEDGYDPKIVQRWHGHADISTTMNIYAKTKENKKLEVAHHLDDKFSNVG